MSRAYAEPVTNPVGVGQGWQEVVILPNPTTSAGPKYTVPGQWIMRPKAISYTITTTTATANVGAVVRYEDPDGVVLLAAPQAVVIGAAATNIQTFGVGCAPGVTAFAQGWISPLGDLILPAGFVINFQTVNVNVNDRLSKCRIVADVWWSDAPRHDAPRRRRRAVR